jgi:DNA-binding NarL/FixJ family response regulator
MQLSCNCCAGGPQTLHAFMLGAQGVQISYASSVAAMYRLTPRESQTLEALLKGLSVKEVATRLNVNPSTVKTFLRSISGKMGVSSRAELMSKVLSLSCNESLQCPFQTALSERHSQEIRSGTIGISASAGGR